MLVAPYVVVRVIRVGCDPLFGGLRPVVVVVIFDVVITCVSAAGEVIVFVIIATVKILIPFRGGGVILP